MQKTEKMHKVTPEVYPSMSESKKIKVYPTVRFDDGDLPELKDMEVGKKYTLVMEVVVKHKAQGTEWGGEDDKQIRATFKVMKIGCEEPEKPKYKNFEEEQAARTRKNSGSRYDK